MGGSTVENFFCRRRRWTRRRVDWWWVGARRRRRRMDLFFRLVHCFGPAAAVAVRRRVVLLLLLYLLGLLILSRLGDMMSRLWNYELMSIRDPSNVSTRLSTRWTMTEELTKLISKSEGFMSAHNWHKFITLSWVNVISKSWWSSVGSITRRLVLARHI